MATPASSSRAEDAKGTLQVEVLTYLGRIGRVLFLVCLSRKTRASLAQIACDVYNLFIQETMIQKDDNIVVYTLDPASGKVETAQAGHINFARADFLGDSLRSAFLRLVREPRPLKQKFLIVSATIEGRRPVKYTYVEIPLDAGFHADLRRLGEIAPNAINIEVEHAISLKPIPYLDVEGFP